MYAPKDMGGLGMPDFEKYYVAAQLAQLSQLHNWRYRPDWVSIEAQACFLLAMDLILLDSSETSQSHNEPTLYITCVGHELQELASAFCTYASGSDFQQPPISTWCATR